MECTAQFLSYSSALEVGERSETRAEHFIPGKEACFTLIRESVWAPGQVLIQ
jgi:hypothetical protein